MEEHTPTLLGLVGDVYINRPAPLTALKGVEGLLKRFDYRFANLESIFTDDPAFAPSALLPAYVPTSNAVGILNSPFQVVSLAHNHTLDAGHAALLETLECLHAGGIQACGAGPDIDAARAPAIRHAKGRSIATLAYASMFPAGYEARHNWPGLAPARAINLYEGTPNHWIPEEPPQIRSVPFEPDRTAMQNDIAKAKAQNDIVVASFHWGDWTRKYHVTDHEKRTARDAIDAGADIVVGHHHHALRGVDWYRGRPIFYGLGHLAFDAPGSIERAARLGLWGGDPDAYGAIVKRPDMPDAFPFHHDMRITAIAWCEIEGDRFSAGYVPCYIGDDNTPYIVSKKDPKFSEIAAYMRGANEAIAVPVRFVPDAPPALAGTDVLRFDFSEPSPAAH